MADENSSPQPFPQHSQKDNKKIIQIVPKKKRKRKNKRSEENFVQKIPQMFSRSFFFFCNFIYPHPGRSKGSAVYQGGFELQVSPPLPARLHHVARGRPARRRGSGGRHFLLWRRVLKCCMLVGSDFCGLFEISFACLFS